MDQTNNYHPKFMHKDDKNRDICSFWIELTSFTVQTTKKFQRQNKVSALTYVTKKKIVFFNSCEPFCVECVVKYSFFSGTNTAIIIVK